jgi:hypothetical protein
LSHEVPNYGPASDEGLKPDAGNATESATTKPTPFHRRNLPALRVVLRPTKQMRASSEQVLVSVLRIAAKGASLEGATLPVEAMTVTRSGVTYTLTIISRVNSTWCWAEDQFGDRWRVAA